MQEEGRSSSKLRGKIMCAGANEELKAETTGSIVCRTTLHENESSMFETEVREGC